ncbi:MAG: hypothetical protein HOQ28_14730 [Thermoleophilia bacterium]|nr:hypothetical protein [Thermoleophilia bacterium]
MGRVGGSSGKRVVDLGAPLADGKSVGGGSAQADVTGFSILQAESQNDAMKLLEGHPHFQTPGGASIEVFEFLDVPGM